MTAAMDTLTAPPQSLEAEQCVLGAILLDKDALNKAVELLTEEDFYRSAHRKIFAAMVDLSEANEEIDNITLAERLKARGDLEAVGGVAYLAELIAAVPSVANIATHARLVAQKSKIRSLRAGLQNAVHAVDNGADLDHLTELIDNLKVETPSSAPSTLTLLATVKPKAIQFLWPGRIPLGKLTVFDGDPGLGKSLTTLDISARVSTARHMPDGSRGHLGGPRGVVLLSAEDDPADTIRPRLEMAGADLTKIAILTEVRAGAGKPRPPHLGDLQALRSAIQDLNAALVVIDPLMAFIPESLDTHRDHDIRRLLAPLAELAAATGAAVLVVRHLNKTQHGNPLYRGGGSIGIVGAARSGLLVAPDPEDPDDRTRVLALTKSNLSAPVPSLRYRVVEAQPGVAGIEWLGTSDQTAVSLLAAAAESSDSRTERDEAADWLKDALKDNPVPVKDLEKQAKAAGHIWVTVKRAKQQLGVKAEKEGFQGEWTWRLPSKEDHANKVIPFGKGVRDSTSNPAKNAKDDHVSKEDHPKTTNGADPLWNEKDGGGNAWLDL